MKIAIVSDTHDNLVNFKKAINWIENEKIKTIIHCGDIGPPSGLKEVIKNFSGKIHLVFGNIEDRDLLTKKISEGNIPNAILYGELGEIKKEGKKIAFCHFPDFAKKIASTGKYDKVFYGHTHKPWEEKIGKCDLVNPGNLAGIFYMASFATYDTKKDKLELKILDKNINFQEKSKKNSRRAKK